MVLNIKIYAVVFHFGLKIGFLYYEGYRESVIPVTVLLVTQRYFNSSCLFKITIFYSLKFLKNNLYIFLTTQVEYIVLNS